MYNPTLEASEQPGAPKTKKLDELTSFIQTGSYGKIVEIATTLPLSISYEHVKSAFDAYRNAPKEEKPARKKIYHLLLDVVSPKVMEENLEEKGSNSVIRDYVKSYTRELKEARSLTQPPNNERNR